MDLWPYLQNASFDYTEYVYLSMQMTGQFGLRIANVYRYLPFLYQIGYRTIWSIWYLRE